MIAALFVEEDGVYTKLPGVDAWGVGRDARRYRGPHRVIAARKATWLYAIGIATPDLRWGPSSGLRLDEGFHSAAERKACRKQGAPPRRRLSSLECRATPIAFRDLLIGMVA